MLLGLEVGMDAYPEDHIDRMAELESAARDGVCLKPKGSIDLFLHARKTEYQSTMDRGDVRIKRVPSTLAHFLIAELNARIHLKDIYFARYADPTRRWEVRAIENDLGEVNADFVDICLKFAPSASLKAITADALLRDDVIHYDELAELPNPEECGYAPFATAPFLDKGILRTPSPKNWYRRWPLYIKSYIVHWGYNEQARQYASDDVTNTRDLYHFFGEPEPNDEDSDLACLVGATRWKGLKVDIPAFEKLRDSIQEKLKSVSFAFNSPKACAIYIGELLSETEKVVITKNDSVSTKGIILEELAKRKKQVICEGCSGMGCDECKLTGLIDTAEDHPVAARAQALLDARHAKKELELFNKILLAGRFHASYKVIGTLSGRMSGTDGLNPQGIQRGDRIRSCFPLAWDNMQLDGGDFESFEVTIADAVWYDPRLRELQLKGMKFHGIFGTYLFPGLTYEQILATKGLDGELDLYSRAKQGVFAMLYGGEEYTLANRVGIEEEAAEVAYAKFSRDFPDLAKNRKLISDRFCSMSQEGGIGTKVEWAEPADYSESIFGFKRYFTLENDICRVLFNLAEKPPKDWHDLKIKVVRRDREQTACGAVRSALFASSFALQASNMRAAGNHVIQSTGATITKKLQCRLWEFQPSGVQTWRVMPTNFHDEIMCPTVPELSDAISKAVVDFVDSYKDKVPLIGMDWSANLDNWSSK